MPSLFDQHREAIRAAGGDAWDNIEDPEQYIRELRGGPTKPTYAFVVWGRGQQRGSKIPSLIPKRGGGFVSKNGRPVLVARDSNKKSGDWMQEVKIAAIDQLGRIALLSGPIELTARFYFVRPKGHFGSGKNAGILKASAPIQHAQSPDLAKLLRSLEDALTKVLWVDDKLVCRYGYGTGRYWTDEQERTEVEIREILS